MAIGATLLEPATGMQHKMARTAHELLDAPAPNGKGRSLAMPMTSTISSAEAWLMVWGTRPSRREPVNDEEQWRDYLRSKKHQLGIPRGAVLVYDEGTRDLVDVYYDGHIGELSAELSWKLAALRPPSSFSGRLHPNAKGPPRGKPRRDHRR